jgi:hypothetical protein
MRGNVLPSIDERDGRMVIIGNWLHTDGLMARLKNTGLVTVLEFSLLREGDGTEAERCTWKAKYPTQEAIDRKRDELGDIGFRREMLLQVVPEEGQDVFPEDITYYDDPPFDDGNLVAHGVDLAISTKESADYTAIVSGEVTWPSRNIEIYILPYPIIRRMTFSETMDTLDNVRKSSIMSSEFFVEAVAYQQVAIEEMERRAFSVQAMHPIKDKRARLRVAARYIKMGIVKFPRHGCEQLLTQLLRDMSRTKLQIKPENSKGLTGLLQLCPRRRRRPREILSTQARCKRNSPAPLIHAKVAGHWSLPVCRANQLWNGTTQKSSRLWQRPARRALQRPISRRDCRRAGRCLRN